MGRRVRKLLLSAAFFGGASLLAQDIPRPGLGFSEVLPAALQEKADAPKAPDTPAPKSNLLDLDLDALSKVQVRPSAPANTGTTSAPTGTGTTITPSTQDIAQGSTGALLDRAASVSLRRTSAINLDPRVRGYHSSQIAASANGATQVRTRIDIDSLFSQIDPGNVESFTVVDGPYSSLFGPGFAFLNAELMRPGRYKNGPESHASTIFTYGYNGSTLYNRERVWGGDATYGYDISYGVRVGNDYRSGDPTDLRVPASYNQQDLFAAFSFDLGDRSRLDLNYTRLNIRNMELPGVVYDINRQTTDQLNVRLAFQEIDGGPDVGGVQFWTSYTPFDVDANRTSKQNRFFSTLIGTNRTELIGGTMFGAGEVRTYGTRAYWTLGADTGPKLTYGVDYRWLKQSYLETNINNANEIAWGGNHFGIPRSWQDDVGFFTHLDTPLTDQLTARIGGRVDLVRSRLRSDDLILQTAPLDPDNGFYRPGMEEPTHTLFMGYGAWDYKATDHWTYSAGVGFAMRAPNLVELYNDEAYQPIYRFGNSAADGNSRLRSEKNLQLDLGVRYHDEKKSFGLRGFHSFIWDYILPIPSTFSNPVDATVAAPTNLHRNYSAFGFDPTDPAFNPDGSTALLLYRYTNHRLATLSGVELTGDAQVNSWVGVSGTLAYVHGVNTQSLRYFDSIQQVLPMAGRQPLPGIYPLNASLRLRVAEPEQQRYGAELVGRFVAGQDRVADLYGELPTSGFTVFDLHAYWQVNKKVKLFTSAINLFDRLYTEHGSLVMSNPAGTRLNFVPERGFTWIGGVEAKY